MSDLKIFIVGPKAAGKTVFACMLNSYVTAHPECGVTFKAANWETKDYFAEIDAAFRTEPWWPDETTRGALIELKWEWAFDSRRALFDLVDPPGEDIQRELRGQDSKLGILDKIRTADVVFVLMDLYGHQGAQARIRTLNGWIVENVLRNASAVRQIVIAVSKGDVMKHRLPVQAWADKDQLMVLLSDMMPEFNLSAYRQQLARPNVQMAMFSAIGTEPYLDSNGSLQHRPKSPFESEGLDIFVKTITQAHESKQLEICIRELVSWVERVLASGLFWKTLGVLTALYAIYWLWHSLF